jgi:hypothetical protein
MTPDVSSKEEATNTLISIRNNTTLPKVSLLILLASNTAACAGAQDAKRVNQQDSLKNVNVVNTPNVSVVNIPGVVQFPFSASLLSSEVV